MSKISSLGVTLSVTLPTASFLQKVTAPTFEVGEGITPELARYLNRNYWEKKSGDLATNQNNASTAQTGSGSRAISGGKKQQTTTPAVSVVTMPSAPEGSITSSVSSVDTRPIAMAAHVTSGNRGHEVCMNELRKVYYRPNVT